MLKRISVEQLRPGMYVNELCGSWMDHPFWRSAFPLKSEEDLRRIRESGISEVWIDTSRGSDVDAGVSKEEAETQVEHRLLVASDGAPRRELVPIEEEMESAARLCAKAKSAVVSMFQEARMGKALDARHALPLVEEISESVMRNPGALISLARLKKRDDYTYMHSVAVCALMVALSRQLDLDKEQTRQAGLGGLVHDLGKSVVPAEILGKPGKLNDEEFRLIKLHPQEGHALLVAGRGAGPIPLDVCLHHHEKVDGSGYPHRLGGKDITLFAKMGAVCDVYDAITSNRPYKNGWDPGDSLRKMAEWSGHFDEKVFRAFVKSIGIYPVGSLVRLESGHLGVVLEQNSEALLSPRVRIFFSIKANSHVAPRVLDLSHANCRDRIADREDPVRWNLGDISKFWAGEARPY
ncbi:MAG TPA: HD-GYP domain-containing protein [Burkholderiales bacterium]|nr:HD-GYP domain-containing protein [Burkholderiales bacterium]